MAGSMASSDPCLWFVLNQQGVTCPIVRIGLSGLPLSMHYRLGQCIQETARKLGRTIAVIASGDLSHRLKAEGPYGFRPEGPEYDQRIMAIMGKAEFGELFSFSERFCAQAGECGHRAFVIMAGALDAVKISARQLSYEGPFGVGYGVCVYRCEGDDPQRDFLRQYQEKQSAEAARRKSQEDAYVKLARRSVEHYVRHGTRCACPLDLPEEMRQRAGVFVSLKKGRTAARLHRHDFSAGRRYRAGDHRQCDQRLLSGPALHAGVRGRAGYAGIQRGCAQGA